MSVIHSRGDTEPFFRRLCIFWPCGLILSHRHRHDDDGERVQCSIISEPRGSEIPKEKQERHFDAAGECPLSPASTCIPAHDDPHPTSFESLEDLDAGTTDEPVCVPLMPGLCFHGPDCATDSDAERPLLEADSIECSASGDVRVLGALRGCEPGGAQETVVVSRVEDLIIDVRVQRFDDPRLVHIVGARVQMGRLDRIFVDLTCSSICCMVSRSNGDRLHISLEQAIQEMFEMERRRRNAELDKYQKHICGNMMRAQRCRYLGLDQ